MDSLAWVQGLSLPFWLHFQLCLNPSQRVKYALLWPFAHSFILPLYLPLTAQNLSRSLRVNASPSSSLMTRASRPHSAPSL